MAVDGGVAAAIDGAAALRADLQPVAVAPHRAHLRRAVAAPRLAAVARGVHVEVARQVAAAVRVAPQVQRHGWNRLRAHQLAHGVVHGAALFVPGFDGGAEHAALHFARHHGQFAVAADEGAAKVGAAREVVPPDIWRAQLGELRRAPRLHLGCQRRAGAAEPAHAAQVAAVGQLQPGLHAIGVKGRARAEAGHAGLGGEAPEYAPIRVLLAATGVAVVDHAGGAAQQAGDLGVPHHPAGGAVPVVALTEGVGGIAGAHVVVQRLELQRHQNHAAVAVHDGLGQAGGAAGVDDPQRVVERQPQRLEGCDFGIVSGGSACVACAISYCFRSIQVVHQQHVLYRGQGCAQLGQHVHAVDVAPAVGHAIGCNQHLGRNLAKAVEHGVRAHVGGAHAPHRAQADRGQEGDDGLGNVGQVGRHAVARLHALRAQVQRQRSHLAAQLGPRQFALQALFVAADQRGLARRMGRCHMAQHLARVVHLCAGKPLGARHAVARQHGAVRGRGFDGEVVPHALPESIELGHRPAPQRVIAGEFEPVALAQPVLVQAQLGNVGGCCACLHGAQRSAHVPMATSPG